MAQLREFIYIDKNSLNSNLSSLGKGIPSEITHASEDQTEKSGGAGGRVMGIGAEGNYGNLNRDRVETTLDITAPYRFQDLLEEINEQNIDIHEDPDPRSLSRGDVVRIKGEVFPMSLLKLEIAFEAFNELSDGEIDEAFRDLGQSPLYAEDEKQEMEAVGTLMKRFIGSELPLRIETDESVYCTSLDWDAMRVPVSEAFVDNSKYTVFGRVNRHVLGNETWDPIQVTNIMDRYMSDQKIGDKVRKDIGDAAEDFNISMEKEDLEVRGHTAVINPIAVYW